MSFSRGYVWVAAYLLVLCLLDPASGAQKRDELKSNGTDGVWCFQCNSNKNKDCLSIEPFDMTSTFYRRCPQFEDEERDGPNRTYFCRKIHQTVIDMHDNEEVRIIRKCGWMKPEDGCYKIMNPAHREMVCACKTNGCNSAPSYISISPALALLSTSLAALLARFAF